MMIRRAWLPMGVVAVSLALMATIQGCDRSGAHGAAFTMPPPVVTTAPVVVEDVPSYLDEIGKTAPFEMVNIVPQVTGQIVRRSFEDGADLPAGHPLFSIETTPFKAALDQAEAALEQSQAQLSNAQSNFNRVAGELPSKAVSQQDYDNAQNAVAVANANAKAAQAMIESAKYNLDNCSIISPIEGRAGARLVDVGNVVTANTTMLLSIQKVTPIYIDFTVPETELDRVRENLAGGPLKVIVHTPNSPNSDITGEVDFLDNSVQNATGAIQLRATVKNKDRALWPGQFVDVRLILTTLKSAKLIPVEALQIGQQGPFVFVVDKDSTVAQKGVTPGQRQGDMVVIEKGLDGNEAIVRTGQMMLNPGVPVIVQNGAAPGGAAPGAPAVGAKS
jgi:membrane fusion protein, multidrug efflux system